MSAGGRDDPMDWAGARRAVARRSTVSEGAGRVVVGPVRRRTILSYHSDVVFTLTLSVKHGCGANEPRLTVYHKVTEIRTNRLDSVVDLDNNMKVLIRQHVFHVNNNPKELDIKA